MSVDSVPPLVQVCAVIVTVALVAIAAATMRAMARFENAGAELARTSAVVRRALDRLREVEGAARALVTTLRDTKARLERISGRFELLAQRASGIAHAFLDELDAPVRRTVAALRGIRSDPVRTISRLVASAGRAYNNTGGSDHV